MLWAALLYAALGNWLANKIGKPLIGLNFNQQRYEADFRYSLMRFRENMEGVALYRGEEDELRGFGTRFNGIYLELVGDHEAPEAAHVVHVRLRPAGGDLPVRGRSASLLLRRDTLWAG